MSRTPKTLQQRPEWLTNTPTTTYLLVAQEEREGEVEFVQEIELGLGEYEGLKKQVASMRGLRLLEPESEAPEPTEEQIQAEIEHLADSILGDFAGAIETARAIWRKWPSLVEAEEFPAQLIAPFHNANDREIDSSWRPFTGTYGDDPMASDFREKLRPLAIKRLKEPD